MAFATCLGPKDYLKSPQCTDSAFANDGSACIVIFSFLLTLLITIFTSQANIESI